MKALFPAAMAAAVALVMSAPLALAFQIQGHDGPPAAIGDDDAVSPDMPAYTRQNLSDRQAVTRGMTSLGTAKLGNTTIHFGASRPGLFDGNNNSPFLDNPAARTVPSQR